MCQITEERYTSIRLSLVGLLSSFLLAFLVPPFFSGSVVPLHLFITSSLCFALHILYLNQHALIFWIPLISLVFIAITLFVVRGFELYLLLFYAGSMLFFGMLIVLFIRQLFSGKVVTTNLLLASINVYFAIGIVFAMIFAIVDSFIPNSFNADLTIRDLSSGTTYMYFSFVTLSTLGYGDLLPVSDQARTLATMEALAGQIYLTIAVARLVGLHVSQNET